MDERLTVEQLAELERLERALPPEARGEWGWRGHGGIHMDATRDWYSLQIDGRDINLRIMRSREVAQYIAAVRNATPALLAELRELRALKQRVEAARDEMRRRADASAAVVGGYEITYKAAANAHAADANLLTAALSSQLPLG